MKRVLVVCDDFYHPGSVVMAGLAPLGGEYILNFVFDSKGFDPSTLDRYQAVVIAKGAASRPERPSWLTERNLRTVLNYVRYGGGLVVVHSGLTGLDGFNEYIDLVGSRFTHHPAQCEVRLTPLKPHPVVEGVEEFRVIDEHYFLADVASDADVFLASASHAGIQAAGYALQRGKGRVCAFTPGHTVEVFHEVPVQQLLRNAIEWVTQR